MDRQVEQDLCNKYNIQLDGFQRNYKVSLDNEFHNLECSTPLEIKINDMLINETAWNKMVLNATIYLCSNYNNVDFLSFRTSSNNKQVFSSVCLSKQYIEVCDNLYLYLNFDSDHAYRYLVELISYCGVNLEDCYLLIHRTPYCEPIEIINSYFEDAKSKFKQFLMSNYNYSEDRSDKVILNIDSTMNKLLSKISKAYNNWFLFTDITRVASYSGKFKEYILDKTSFSKRAIKQMNKYLILLNEYYRAYFNDRI